MNMTTTMIEFREVDSEEMTSVDGGSGDVVPPLCGFDQVYHGRPSHPLAT
jgi:hypothetical protein